MSEFELRGPIPTPWGTSDSTVRISDGIYWVSTPSHGGVLVGQAVARERLSAGARAVGQPFGAFLAFEEDCDWAAVVAEVPEAAAYIAQWNTGDVAQEMSDALDCLRRWNAETYFQTA